MYDTDAIQSSDLTYVRKVYLWFFVGVLAAAVAAWTSINLGLPETIMVSGQPTAVPPLVARVLEHPVITILTALGLTFIAGLFRKTPPINAIAYFTLTPLLGLIMGPSIWAAEVMAHRDQTLSGHPVRDALFLTVAAFGSLTGYVFVSKKDFFAWGGFLMSGLWVLIVASILGIFIGSSVLDLALASVEVILFLGFVLYDTSKILRGPQDDAIGDALNLFLDAANLFLDILRILTATKKD
jgi:modulator of FtsH protease